MVKRAIVLLILLSVVGLSRPFTTKQMRENTIRINALEVELVEPDKKVEDVKVNNQTPRKDIPKVITLSEDKLYFDFDKSIVKPEYYGVLKEVVDLVEENNLRVSIKAHTDSKGTEKYNNNLSERRAIAVRDKLIDLGLNRNRIVEVKGMGENYPVAPNTNPNGTDNPSGRALNRRVEFELIK